MKPVQFSCQIEKISSNKDKTLTIKLETQELIKEDTSYLFDLQGLQIWAAFSGVEIAPEDIDVPEVLKEFKNDKSPSERLRARMYVYYEKIKGRKDGFNEWYANALDKIGLEYLERTQ